MTAGGAIAFLLTIYWVRTRDLREKYAMVWIGVAAGVFVIGLFPTLFMAAADALHLAYPSAVLFLALTAIYTSLFGISVSISRQFRRNARLMQEMAILEMRLRQLEMRADKGASEQPEA
jgi:hypothetical protein